MENDISGASLNFANFANYDAEHWEPRPWWRASIRLATRWIDTGALTTTATHGYDFNIADDLGVARVTGWARGDRDEVRAILNSLSMVLSS